MLKLPSNLKQSYFVDENLQIKSVPGRHPDGFSGLMLAIHNYEKWVNENFPFSFRLVDYEVNAPFDVPKIRIHDLFRCLRFFNEIYLFGYSPVEMYRDVHIRMEYTLKFHSPQQAMFFKLKFSNGVKTSF